MSVFSHYGKYTRARSHSESRCEATSPISIATTATVTSPKTSSSATMRIQVSASGLTDPGRPEKQNQDAFFMLHDEPHAAMVLGVFDGHGRETGKDAAQTAKAFFEAHFRSFTADQYRQLEADPHGVFVQLFRSCHEMIKSVFRGIYEQRGYVVFESDGSLIRKDHGEDDDDGICIRGGTCATVVVLLHGGRKIISANVGDSAVLIGAREPMLSSNDVRTRTRSAGGIDIQKKKTTSDGLVLSFDDEIKKESLLLTGNHSADSESEFLRVRKHSFGSPEAQVQFVYDCSSRPATCSRATTKKRMPIFNVSPRGLVQQNMVGDYYKNVRDEWATIVTTPIEAPFPDSLAFTRSLGDFHMHKYGVCDEPTVQELCLESVVMKRAARSPQRRSSPTCIDDASMNHLSSPEPDKTEFFLVVASDGVWDNWKYEELVEFLVERNHKREAEPPDPSPLRFWPSRPVTTSSSNQSNPSQSHVDRLASALMEANLERAERIFGDQADNMTAVVCQLDCSLI